MRGLGYTVSPNSIHFIEVSGDRWSRYCNNFGLNDYRPSPPTTPTRAWPCASAHARAVYLTVRRESPSRYEATPLALLAGTLTCIDACWFRLLWSSVRVCGEYPECLISTLIANEEPPVSGATPLLPKRSHAVKPTIVRHAGRRHTDYSLRCAKPGR